MRIHSSLVPFGERHGLKKCNFAEAERLCKEALEQNVSSRGVSPWLHSLYSVYEASGDGDKIASTAEEIVLQGDLSYYDKLKEALNRLGQWDTEYPGILKKFEIRLSASGYMQILAKEREYAKLLAILKRNTAYIYQYGASLAAEYRNDVNDIFMKQISHEAEQARNRTAYNAVCGHIAVFAEAGYPEAAIELTVRFLSVYKRRPAFVDELNKVKISL